MILRLWVPFACNTEIGKEGGFCCNHSFRFWWYDSTHVEEAAKSNPYTQRGVWSSTVHEFWLRPNSKRLFWHSESHFKEPSKTGKQNTRFYKLVIRDESIVKLTYPTDLVSSVWELLVLEKGADDLATSKNVSLVPKTRVSSENPGNSTMS